MAVDNVQINSNTGVDGSSYTSSISNDQLTNDDFLKLMIEELKLQDPTKPMDSARMLSTQMQMSTINTNLETIKTMETLAKTFSQSALSNAANVIGKSIEDGNIGENGINKAYTVISVENVDGEITVKAQQILYLERHIKDSEGNLIEYDINGEIYDEEVNKTGQKEALANPGDPILRDGKLVILDENNEEIEDSGYELNGTIGKVYSDQLTSIPFSNITKIF